jgi:hypothetical protein
VIAAPRFFRLRAGAELDPRLTFLLPLLLAVDLLALFVLVASTIGSEANPDRAAVASESLTVSFTPGDPGGEEMSESESDFLPMKERSRVNSSLLALVLALCCVRRFFFSANVSWIPCFSAAAVSATGVLATSVDTTFAQITQ